MNSEPVEVKEDQEISNQKVVQLVETLDRINAGENKSSEMTTVVINTDDECRECLENLRATMILSEEHIALLDACILVVSAKDDDNLLFGPPEIMGLFELAMAYPTRSNEITACTHHLVESIECDGDFPPDSHLVFEATQTALSNMMSVITSDGTNLPTLNADDEISEESITDDEL
jgi:hypothetical protein